VNPDHDPRQGINQLRSELAEFRDSLFRLETLQNYSGTAKTTPSPHGAVPAKSRSPRNCSNGATASDAASNRDAGSSACTS